MVKGQIRHLREKEIGYAKIANDEENPFDSCKINEGEATIFRKMHIVEPMDCKNHWSNFPTICLFLLQIDPLSI